MRTALLPWTALVALLGIAVAPACGFPSLSYESDAGELADAARDGTSHADGGGEDVAPGDASTMPDAMTTTDGEAPGDGSSDVATDTGSVDVGGDSSAMDSGSHDSSTPPPDAGSDAGVDCDQDHDGYLSNSAQCGGNDCCDTDSNAHPTQGMYFTSADNCGSFDYDCDGTLETEWGAFACTPGVTGCTPTSGFVGGVPGCGVSEQWTGTCKNMITSCQPGTTAAQAQACH